MSGHTPGPWTVRREGLNGDELIVRSTVQIPDPYEEEMYEPTVADLYRGGTGNLDDALLIAAAPDLLEALKHCEEVFTRYEINRINGEEIAEAALTKIRAAIAKATG